MTILYGSLGALISVQVVLAVDHHSSSLHDGKCCSIDPSRNGSLVHSLPPPNVESDTTVQSAFAKPPTLHGTWITASDVTEVGTLHNDTKYTAAVTAKLDLTEHGGSFRGVLNVDKQYTTARGNFSRAYQVVMDLTYSPKESLQWISGKVKSAEVRTEGVNPHALPYRSMDVAVLLMSAKRLTLSVNLDPGLPRRYQYHLWSLEMSRPE
jgi:hypothetical protein